jgi:D-alanyl-D-alanine-carboxypeptidase/D-alanyl-D-alanine-endopeptidase
MLSLRRFSPTFLILALSAASAVQGSSAQGLPASLQQKVQSVLRESVAKGETLGAVVGIVTPRGKWVRGEGLTALEGGHPPDGDTLFEIGSLSKVFLDLLLEEAILQKKVRLDDPVVKHLPPDMPFPKIRELGIGGVARDKEPDQVTLWHLATHTSGFPTMPSRVDLPKEWDPEDPSYVTLDMARTLFKRFTFSREPGLEYEYSNINTALLGYILSLKFGQDLEGLLQRRVLRPLGLRDTAITLSPQQKRRLSKGYTTRSKESTYVNTPIPFSGGGSLKSTANDLLKYLEKAAGLVPSPLEEGMSHQTRVVESRDGPDRTLGYFYYQQPYGDVFLVRSRTLGFRCCMGFIPSRRIGVVILGNCMRFDTPKVFQSILEAVVEAETPSSERVRRGKKFEGGADGAFRPTD